MAPTESAALDLDVLEDEDDEKGPFTVKAGGQLYELQHPKSMDYRELLELLEIAGDGGAIDIHQAVAILPKLVPNEQREAFFANEFPPFKLKAVMAGYLEHFELGKVDVPEAGASSPS